MSVVRKTIGYYLTRFLEDYLPRQRNLSVNTIHSYAWTFKLFFLHGKQKLNKPAEKMFVDNFDKSIVTDFLDWLEGSRASSPASRNQRLSALRSLFKFIQYESPEHMAVCQDVLSIPNKKATRPEIGHLGKRELSAILSAPDAKTMRGKRAIAIMTLLYDTGARVSELANLRIKDVHHVDLLYVTLFGKGSKRRDVAIMPETFNVVMSYMNAFGLNIDRADQQELPLFFNSRREPLTRSGIAHILSQYVEVARKKHSSIPAKVTPHVFRHTKAVHLHDIGVPYTNIRDILGHASVKTTEIYARLSIAQKHKYMSSLSEGVELKHAPSVWETKEDFYDWLDKYCK